MSEVTGTPTPKRPTRTDRTEKEPVPVVAAPAPAKFDYQLHLEDRDGTPYLPLKWRLIWLRAEHPQAKVLTRLISHEGGLAMFRAEIRLPDGGSATGWGARSQGDNSDELDYLAYAENQALSRALTVLGYGTEFAQDFDPPIEHPAILLLEDDEDDDEDEPGYVVPISLAAASAVDEDADDETEEDDDDEEEEAARPAPVRGTIRNLNERRADFERPAERPAAPPTELRPPVAPPTERPRTPEPPTPITRNTPPAPRPLGRPTPPPVERPTAPANEEAAVNHGPVIGNVSVEERIKNVRDDSLRLLLKQIYHEARTRFNLDEDRVDDRSRKIFNGKATYELDINQATEYHERILNSPSRRR